MHRFINYLKHNGFFKTTKRVIKALPKRIFICLGYIITILKIVSIRKECYNIIHSSKYKFIDIYDVSFGWNQGLFQRPQQIAKALANEECLVLYSMNIFEKKRFINPIRNILKNLWYIDYKNPIIKKIIIKLLKKSNKKMYYHIYSTNSDYTYFDILTMYKNSFNIIYEYIDSIEITNDNFIKARHIKIMEDNEILIITTSLLLYNEISNKNHKRCILVENGVDFSHWQVNKKEKNSIPKVGYFGALAPDWFDFELLHFISEKNKNIEFDIIGPFDYSGPSGISPLTIINSFNNENVKFLGKINYIDLPNIANNFDICIIPFIINNITLAVSPLKLYEYLSMGKPVITTNMPECVKHKIVLHTNDYDEFSKKINEALVLSESEEYSKNAKSIAFKYDWSNKAREIIENLYLFEK